MTRVLWLSVLLALGVAFAHADLTSSEPAANAVLAEAPAAVLLEFTEPVETMFSVFKVYRLEADVDLSADNAQQRLAGLAGALVNVVLDLREDDAARLDTEVQPAGGTAKQVSLTLAADLPAGHYVVMWRVLSVDTHVTEGFFAFSVE